MAAALEVKQAVEQKLLQIPGVVGVGVGKRQREVIRVYVEKPIPGIPEEIGGFPVEVIVSGVFKPLSLVQIPYIPPASPLQTERTEKRRPALGGISIGHVNISAGTLGSRVFDAVTGERLILSNNHVLACSDSEETSRASIGDPIVQPGCYSEDTEVLTEDGWKRFDEISEEDEIWTLNAETKKIEFQNPTKIWKYWCKGQMIHWKGQMYDLLVTPEHNVYCRIESRKSGISGKKLCHGGNGWRLRKAIDLIDYEIELSKTGLWTGEDKKLFKLPKVASVNAKQIEELPMDLWLKFLGWWISEGSIYHGKKRDYRILIKQTNNENVKEIISIIRQMGFNPSRSKNGDIQFCSKQLYRYLKQFGHAPDKFIPLEFKRLPTEKIRILLTYLFKGDGTFISSSAIKQGGYKEKYRGSFRHYTTVSKKLADDILELLIKIGVSGKISMRPPAGVGKRTRYEVGVVNRNLTPRTTKKPRLIDYEGFVYDVTVPNHILMIRRNGNPLWSGNSYDGGRVPDDQIGMLLRWVKLRETGVNYVDAALARPLMDEDLSDEILEVGVVASWTEAVENMVVQKSGRTSKLTTGVVLDVNATITVDYGAFKTIFKDQIVTDFMARPGDSGSLLVSRELNAVGLLFAGSETVTAHNKMSHVMELLGLDFQFMPPPPPRTPSWPWVQLPITTALASMLPMIVG